MPEPSSSRRGFLLAAGTAALAGCSDLDGAGRSSQDGISVTELPDVPEEGESEPIIEDDIPVDIERETLRTAATRVTDLLGTVPLPLGVEEVPNGYVRRELVDAAEEATDHLDDARSAGTRFAAMNSLRRARSEARFAAEGWAFVDRDRSTAELRAEHRETVAEAESFESAREYIGDDPVRAVVVHGHVEDRLRRVLADREPSVYDEEGSLLTVAEWGEHAESARGNLADGRYLHERFRSSLSASAADLEGTFEAAAESLVTDLERRADELPTAEEPDERDLAWEVQYGLRTDAERSPDYATGDTGPASAVVEAVEGLTNFRAYERVRERAADGERFAPESGADVREARTAALDAIRASLEETARPALARSVLADAAALVAFADDALARVRTDVRPARLDDPMARYYRAAARARSVPAATAQVVDELES